MFAGVVQSGAGKSLSPPHPQHACARVNARPPASPVLFVGEWLPCGFAILTPLFRFRSGCIDNTPPWAVSRQKRDYLADYETGRATAAFGKPEIAVPEDLRDLLELGWTQKVSDGENWHCSPLPRSALRSGRRRTRPRKRERERKSVCV